MSQLLKLTDYGNLCQVRVRELHQLEDQIERSGGWTDENLAKYQEREAEIKAELDRLYNAICAQYGVVP